MFFNIQGTGINFGAGSNINKGQIWPAGFEFDT